MQPTGGVKSEAVDSLLSGYEGHAFSFGSPLRPEDMAHLTFSPFKPNVDHLSSPFTFMNQLSPLIKLGNGQLMSPGLTPLLGQSMDSLNPMPVSNLMDAANFGIASPPSAGASPSQQFGFGRLNSVRKIEFGDPDASADVLASRFQEPRSLTQLHAGEDEEHSRDGMDFCMPHTEVTVSDMDDEVDARLDDSRVALATRVGLPPAKRAHVEFELQSSDDGERAHHAPAKAAPRRKAPQAQKTKLRSRTESAGDSQLVSPVPHAAAAAARAYSTPSNRPLPSNDATPVPAAKRSTPCNCKKSKCLKLYCECFANNRLCGSSCNCSGCCNSSLEDGARAAAVQATLERNPNAFQPRVVKVEALEVVQDTHSKGCHCKKSGCLKKYCECFQSGLICGSSCKCLDCHNVHGNPQLSEIRRVPSKKSSHPRRPVPAGGGSDGSPVPGGPASARLSDGEEGSSGRPVRASGRASKRSLARIASQLLLDDDDDDDFDDSDDESSEDEGVKAKPAATLRRDVAPLAMLAKSAPSRSKPKSKEAPPAASPPLVRQPAPPTKRQASKARLPRELHVDVNEAQPAASPAAPPFNDMFQPSSAESHNLSLALPLRRWPPTCVLPCHVPRHRTFGLRNPALSDPMVTTVLSYLANDDIYNSSLVCMAWAALAMDVALWNWDGVEVNATLVAGAPTRDVPLSTDHFDPMVSLTPHRHSRPFAGLPFLDMHDDNMSAMSPARPPGRHAPSFEPAAQTWAPGPNVVRMSMMSPLLAMSPERGYAPDALEAPLLAVKTGGAGKRRR